MNAHLPTDARARKAVPLYSGLIKYFPKALAAVAELSRIGNDQHNPGQPLHWDRAKSTDELDAAARHLVEAGAVDTDGVRHSAKLAWRGLANLEKELEKAVDAINKMDEFAEASNAANTNRSDFPPERMEAVDAETGARVPLDGILSPLPPHRHGFLVGQVVNTHDAAYGQYPGEVVGFKDGKVHVLWNMIVNSIAAYHHPSELRHGP